MKAMRLTLPNLKHEKTERQRTEMFTNFTNELLSFGSAYVGKKQALESDQDLSDKGRAKKLAEVRNTFVPQLTQYQQRLGAIKKQFEDEANAEYRAKPYQGTGNPVLDYMVARDLREYLKSLPLAERVRVVLDPNSDPTGQLLHAVVNSPTPDLGITPEVISRANYARAMSLNPGGMLAVEDQATVLETLEHNMNEVRKAMEITPESVANQEKMDKILEDGK